MPLNSQATSRQSRPHCLFVPAAIATTPWRAGGWTRKQIVGHLCDSAANNRQRFVRASIDGQYAGPGYAQDAWVDAHGYAGMEWATLLRWWQVEHEILKAAVARIPADRLGQAARSATTPQSRCAFSSKTTSRTSSIT